MVDFATVAELELRLGTSGLGARGTALLADASALIRAECDFQDLDARTGRQEEFAGDDDTYRLFLSQRPVTAVTSVEIDGVAFTDYEWARWGRLERNDEGAWSEGPIIVTYDSGYATDDDEWAALKQICCAVAGRGITRETPETAVYGPELSETRGGAVPLYLTTQEIDRLRNLGAVPIG